MTNRSAVNTCAGALLLCAVTAVTAVLAGCQSPEQIQAAQDKADDQRCARMGVPIVPGDPQYIQCRMWAAQTRDQEEQARRQAWLAVLLALNAGRQRPPPVPPDSYGAAPYDPSAYDPGPYGARPYDLGPYGTFAGERRRWIVPPPAPQTTWCRPVGPWMSCTQN